jgi:hypothetical protein
VNEMNLNDLKRIHRCLVEANVEWLIDPATGCEVKVDSVLADIIDLESGKELPNLLIATPTPRF